MAGERVDPEEAYIPSVDVCAFCGDSECDGLGCLVNLDPNDLRDQRQLERLHDLLRFGRAWEVMRTVLREGDPAADAIYRADAALQRAGYGASLSGSTPSPQDQGAGK